MDDFISPPEPVQAVGARRAAPMPWARIGLLGVAVAALLAAAILAFGSTATPNGILAAGTTTDNGSTIVEDLKGAGGRGLLGFGHGGITITAISGNSISLATGDGWTRTITVDSGTTYAKGGATISLGDLKVGDKVRFRQTKETNGSFTIDKVVVILPRLGGQVTAINGSTITVTQRDGTTGTITVTGATTFKVAGADATLADLKVGMFLVAEGTENGDSSITATDVHAGMAGKRGEGKGGFGPRDDHDGNGPRSLDSTAAPSATGTAG